MRYDGRSRVRVVEPHLLYRSEQGVIVLLAYQVRGYHSSKRRGCFWRPFQLGKIESIKITDELYSTRAREGFENVRKLIQGQTLAMIRLSNTYVYFKPAVYGPPAPAYLASSPSLMMRIVDHSAQARAH